jgi:hypothetical protein
MEPAGNDGGVVGDKRKRSKDNDDDDDFGAGRAKTAYATAEQRDATGELFELTFYRRDDTMGGLCETRTLHQLGKVGAILWFGENGENVFCSISNVSCMIREGVFCEQGNPVDTVARHGPLKYFPQSLDKLAARMVRTAVLLIRAGFERIQPSTKTSKKNLPKKRCAIIPESSRCAIPLGSSLLYFPVNRFTRDVQCGPSDTHERLSHKIKPGMKRLCKLLEGFTRTDMPTGPHVNPLLREEAANMVGTISFMHGKQQVHCPLTALHLLLDRMNANDWLSERGFFPIHRLGSMISDRELGSKEGKYIEKCCPFAMIPTCLNRLASRLRETATAARTAGFEGGSPPIEIALGRMNIFGCEGTSESDEVSEGGGQTIDTQSTERSP